MGELRPRPSIPPKPLPNCGAIIARRGFIANRGLKPPELRPPCAIPDADIASLYRASFIAPVPTSNAKSRILGSNLAVPRMPFIAIFKSLNICALTCLLPPLYPREPPKNPINLLTREPMIGAAAAAIAGAAARRRGATPPVGRPPHLRPTPIVIAPAEERPPVTPYEPAEERPP